MFRCDVISLSESQYADVANGVMLSVNAGTQRFPRMLPGSLTGFHPPFRNLIKSCLLLGLKYSVCLFFCFVLQLDAFLIRLNSSSQSCNFILKTTKSCKIQKTLSITHVVSDTWSPAPLSLPPSCRAVSNLTVLH